MFLKFIEKTPPTGKSIICIDNKYIRKIFNRVRNKNILTYGESRNANYQVLNLSYKTNFSAFDLKYKDIQKKMRTIKNIQLKLLGKHNILNAAAAVAVCLNLGVNQNTIKQSLKKYSGVQRRMTKIFTKNNNDFYDDYAHHPTEIRSILEELKMYTKTGKLYRYLNLTVIPEYYLYKKNTQSRLLNLTLFYFAQYMLLGSKKRKIQSS